jgi:hypothetical protein
VQICLLTVLFQHLQEDYFFQDFRWAMASVVSYKGNY